MREGDWQAYRCPLSGRLLFDEYQANFLARRLLQQAQRGWVEVRQVDGEVVAAWRWCSVQQVPVQDFGLSL
jgi:uncharacterized protein YecT (DUF1311 family)